MFVTFRVKINLSNLSYLRQQTSTTCSCLSSDGRSSMVSLFHWFSHCASGLLSADHEELPFADHDHKWSADPPCNASWGAVQQKPVQEDQAAPLDLDRLCVVQPPGGQARLTPWWWWWWLRCCPEYWPTERIPTQFGQVVTVLFCNIPSVGILGVCHDDVCDDEWWWWYWWWWW